MSAPTSTKIEDFITVPVFELEQPLGTFYVGKMSARDLQRIAAADTRRKVDREVEVYTGIQRELSQKRQKEIGDYIGTYDASFPNAFIIAIKSEDLIEPVNGVMKIRADEKVASIIDGQHRLSGFSELNKDNFDLIVSIFVDLPIEDQAMLFATINLKQTKVNSSLVFDLFEETKLRSPEKTCHNICKSLNQEPTSPFFHQIKPLGKRTEDYVGRLTQATFVKQLLPHVCKNPEAVRDLIKRGGKPEASDPVNQDCIFWNFFCEEKDWAILKVLTNYFSAVATTFADDWRAESSPLSRTIGYAALMNLLEPVVRLGRGKNPPTLDQEFFTEQFTKAKGLAPFSFEQYPAGGIGEKKLVMAIGERILPPSGNSAESLSGGN
jgi:DGQHR domain-containing protein